MKGWANNPDAVNPFHTLYEKNKFGGGFVDIRETVPSKQQFITEFAMNTPCTTSCTRISLALLTSTRVWVFPRVFGGICRGGICRAAVSQRNASLQYITRDTKTLVNK